VANDVSAVGAEMTLEPKERMVLQGNEILAEMNFVVGPVNYFAEVVIWEVVPVPDHVDSKHLTQKAVAAAAEDNAAAAVAFPLPIGLHRLVVNL
jgi:hypothetical protein